MSTLSIIKNLPQFAGDSRLTAQAIEKLQQARLRELLEHTFHHSPFYRELYTSHGIRERDLHEISLAELPIIDKELMMQNYDAFLCNRSLKRRELEDFLALPANLYQSYRGKYKVLHTSGSTGRIGLFVYGPPDWARLKAMVLSRVTRNSLNPFKKTKLAFIGATHGHFAGVSLSVDAPRFLFDVLLLPVDAPLPETVARLNAFQPDMLNGYSSGQYLLALEQLAGRLAIKPSSVIGSGDAMTPLISNALSEAFGLEPASLYAATESICLGLMSRPGEKMHLFNDWHIFEILDERNRPTACGRPGQLVLTNLYNYTQPLIRYRMQDRLIPAPPAQNTPAFQRVEAIIGRSTETLAFTDKSGRKKTISPHILTEFFVPGLKKFQFFQPDAHTLHMKVCLQSAALQRQTQDALVQSIHRKMEAVLADYAFEENFRFTVKVVDDLRVCRETGKFKVINPLKEG